MQSTIGKRISTEMSARTYELDRADTQMSRKGYGE